MRTLGRITVTLVLAGLIGATALGQQRPPFGGFGGMGTFGGGMLLANKSVQDELKLSKEQVEKVTAASEKAREKNRELFTKFKDLPKDEQREKFQEAMKVAGEEGNKVQQEILNADQRKRLQQIELQIRGIQAFTDEEVQKKLALTDDQKDKLKLIGEDSRKELDDLRKSSGQNVRELFQRMPAIRKEAMERANAILKDDQKKTMAELTGAPFEMKIEPGQFGGRPGAGQKKDKQ